MLYGALLQPQVLPCFPCEPLKTFPPFSSEVQQSMQRAGFLCPKGLQLGSRNWRRCPEGMFCSRSVCSARAESFVELMQNKWLMLLTPEGHRAPQKKSRLLAHNTGTGFWGSWSHSKPSRGVHCLPDFQTKPCQTVFVCSELILLSKSKMHKRTFVLWGDFFPRLLLKQLCLD